MLVRLIAQQCERQRGDAGNRNDLLRRALRLFPGRQQRGSAERSHVEGAGGKLRADLRGSVQPREVHFDVELRRLGVFLDQLQIFADIERQKRQPVADADLDLLLLRKRRHKRRDECQDGEKATQRHTYKTCFERIRSRG